MIRAIRATSLLIAVVMLAALTAEASNTPAGGGAGKQTSDSAITSKVREVIGDIPGLTAPQYVKVGTTGGVVYLFGFVDTSHQIPKVIDAARQVEGVKSVHSYLSAKKYTPGDTP